ncbi:hypothetical protein JCM8547_000025 [Rhodosporidiobolus lusitaniae]
MKVRFAAVKANEEPGWDETDDERDYCDETASPFSISAAYPPNCPSPGSPDDEVELFLTLPCRGTEEVQSKDDDDFPSSAALLAAQRRKGSKEHRPPTSAISLPFNTTLPSFLNSSSYSTSPDILADHDLTLPDPSITRNTLTRKEKRELVWRSRKLERVLGATFKEEAAERVLVTRRDQEGKLAIPLRSPSLYTPDSSSSPSTASFSPGFPGSPFSPFLLLASPISRPISPSSFTDSLHSSPVSSTHSDNAIPLGRAADQLEREKQRRKLSKVQRVLGERVPLALVIEPKKVASSRTGEQKELPGIRGMVKARKLEELFGDLPPQSLYLPTSAYRHPASPLFNHRRTVSDLSSLSSPLSPTFPYSFYPASPQLSPTTLSVPNLLRSTSTSSVSSINSYRKSLENLACIIVYDPDALSVASVVFDREKGEVHGDEEEEKTEVRAGWTTRTAGMSGRRAVSSALKLSAFFGATKGEVWRTLLDDISTSATHDPTLDDDERAEVLRSVEQLRAKGKTSFRIPPSPQQEKQGIRHNRR